MPARRSVPLAAALATATLLGAPAADAQAPAPAPARTITAVAAGRVTVNRNVAKNSAAIAAAVDVARDRAIPLAIRKAREEAQRLAAAGGLTLGPLVAVSEPEPSPFFGGPGGAAYGTEGTFGPGKFCGRIRTPIRRRTASGALRFTGRFRSHFGCRIPSEVAQTVSATFAAG
jgi:Protein of unknown function (DUF541)